MILTPAELELLTGKTERAEKRYGSQAEVLRALGVPFLPRPDGSLIVYRTDAQRTPQEERFDAPALVLP